jgi:creatinine amidohydrolase/Fe(II)-dependent formamide hydrolase-like protein
MSFDNNPTCDGAVEWVALTVDELRPKLKSGAVGLWAIGATEQHGHHLVTGFDHLVADAVVRARRRLSAPKRSCSRR